MAMKGRCSKKTVSGDPNDEDGQGVVMSVSAASRPPALRARRLRRQRVGKVVVLSVVLAFLLIPLLSMLLFTVRQPLSGRWNLDAWKTIFLGGGDSTDTDGEILWTGLSSSLELCVITVVIMLVLLLPTMVVLHLRSRRMEKIVEWVAMLPVTIPAIVLVVGLGPIYRWLSSDVLDTDPIWLCFAYVILVMPFAFRALAVGLSSVDIGTLCEAARSLGSSWTRVFLLIVIPGMWPAILSASFISVAVVLGEYTVASLLGRMNLQVALFQLGQSNSQVSTAMSLLALLFGALLLVAVDCVAGAVRHRREKR